MSLKKKLKKKILFIKCQAHSYTKSTDSYTNMPYISKYTKAPI